MYLIKGLLTINWISRTPSAKSCFNEPIGGYPFDSSFVFSLQTRARQVKRRELLEIKTFEWVESPPFAESSLLNIPRNLFKTHSSSLNDCSKTTDSRYSEEAVWEKARTRTWTRLEVRHAPWHSFPPRWSARTRQRWQLNSSIYIKGCLQMLEVSLSFWL